MKKTLGWGVIGCGDVFEKKSGPSIAAAERSRLVALTRRDCSERERMAAVFDAPKAPADAERVIADPEVDIVYIATPPSSHAEHVLKAAAAGKHVLVEKPMGLTARDSERMAEACETAGVELFTAYYRRFWPNVLEMKRLIETGAIGRPAQAFFDFSLPWNSCPGGWRLRPEVSGGGYFADMGSHRLDLWVYFFGDVSDASGAALAHPEHPGAEQVASACVTFANGVQGLARSDFLSGRVCDRFEVIGTRGRIHTDRLDGHAFEVEGGQPARFSFERLAAPHLGLMRHIEEVLLDGKENRSPGREGLVTDRILDAVLGRNAANDRRNRT